MGHGHPQPDSGADNLVVHHLKLECAEERDIQQAVAEIEARFACDKVCFDAQRQVLNLAYDAARLNMDGIGALLSKHHLKVSHDWWTHSREGYNCLVAGEKKEKRRQ